MSAQFKEKDAIIRPIETQWAGRIAYVEAWSWQKDLVAARKQSPNLPDQLILLEHPPTYTMGRSGSRDNLLLNEAALAEKGFTFYTVDRGGDMTYHGPGQLVGYPILNLVRLYRKRGLGSIRGYVDDLEEVIIQTLAHFQITGIRHEEHRGVWVETAAGLAKIAAIGVRVSGKGISSHGFALNIAPDMSHFDHIIPCGIDDLGVTSITSLTREPHTIETVLPRLLDAFESVFKVDLQHRTALPIISDV